MNMFKSGVNTLLARFGFELRRKPSALAVATPTKTIRSAARASFVEGLAQVKQVGFEPATIVDVGAAHGNFTRACLSLFPNARYLVVEPLIEFRAGLQALASEHQNVTFENVAAGTQDGTATFHVHRDWDGSSLYRETEGAQVDGVERTVPLRSLDSLAAQYQLPAPYLIKVDVQGAELDVLRGGLNTLRGCEYVLLEVAMYQFFVGGPQFADVVEFMHARNFAAYDIFGTLYRPLDNALSQVDMAFVRADGIFRQHHIYATPEQRSAQNQQFEAYHKNQLE